MFVVFSETNEVDAMVKRGFVVGLLDRICSDDGGGGGGGCLFFLLMTNE